MDAEAAVETAAEAAGEEVEQERTRVAAHIRQCGEHLFADFDEVSA